jgi:hypothetical protein
MFRTETTHAGVGFLLLLSAILNMFAWGTGVYFGYRILVTAEQDSQSFLIGAVLIMVSGFMFVRAFRTLMPSWTHKVIPNRRQRILKSRVQILLILAVLFGYWTYRTHYMPSKVAASGSHSPSRAAPLSHEELARKQITTRLTPSVVTRIAHDRLKLRGGDPSKFHSSAPVFYGDIRVWYLRFGVSESTDAGDISVWVRDDTSEACISLGIRECHSP